MDEKLVRQLQHCINSIPLLVVGSGASMPFGLPSMEQLGEHLKNKITFQDTSDQQQFNEFKTKLEKLNNLEAAMTNLQLSANVLKKIIVETWQLINQLDIRAYDSIISGATFHLNELIKYLTDTAGKRLSIVTTNYDRLIEYAASQAGAYINTGFIQNYYGEFQNDIKIQSTSLKAIVNIWKVHGSLDWFKNEHTQSIHLPIRHQIPNDYCPCIVTPGSSKYTETHNDPYRSIISNADSAIKQATGFFCIGYGFNDDHIQPYIIKQIQESKPIVVLAKKLTQKTRDIIINKTNNYILIEESQPNNTLVISPETGDIIIEGQNYWQLGEFLKLVK